MATNEPKKAAWYKISRYMLSCKATYFFLLAKEISFRMNLVLFLNSIGLSKSQAGLVVGIRLLSVMVSAPFFGMIADKFKMHRIVITLCSLVAFVCTCIQPVLAYEYGPTRFLYCDNGISKYDMKTSINSSSNLNVTGQVQKEIAAENIFKNLDINRLFWIMLATNIFQSFFDGALDGFIDVGVMVRLKQRNEKSTSSTQHYYGTQRIPSILGQAIGPVIVNYAIDEFPTSRVTCYTGIFVIYGVIQLLYLLSLLWLFHGLDFSHENEDKRVGDAAEHQEMIERKQPNNKATFKYSLCKTLFEEEMLMMFLSLFLAGVLMSEILNYSFSYLKDLRATTMEFNFYLIFFNIGNLIGFLFAQKIIQICGGPFQALVLMFFSYVIRFIGMATSNSPLVVSIFQILSIFDMPITETASLEFVMHKSPKIVLASIIGLMNAIQYSLPDVVGGTLGGFVYELYSGKVLFYGCSIMAAVTGIVVTAWKLIRRNHRRHVPQGQDVNMVDPIVSKQSL